VIYLSNKVKIVVLDVLKPHKPDIIDFGIAIENEKSVKCLNLNVYAVDEKTESIKIILEGNSLNIKSIKKKIEDMGAVIHSVDKAVIGEKKIIDCPK
jgi:hypothetical protein